MMNTQPSYLELLQGGTLAEKAEEIAGRLGCCDLCPRECGVNRLNNEVGSCGIGSSAWVSSYGPHHGEEDPLRGIYGSGTIFFSGCNLSCLYCQNADISQQRTGYPVSPTQLAGIMLEIQAMGCHNINLVSPTHVAAQIALALVLAAEKGLTLPLVYNSGGYDSLSTLSSLEGMIDVYMPDMKYSTPEVGARYSGVEDYPQRNRAAVLEMHRQVGDLMLDESGIALRGLLIRHLILPDDLAGSQRTLAFIAREISPATYLNIMDQYRPAHRAGRYPELVRGITKAEYLEVIGQAKGLGLTRLDRG
ncbi:MAG: radical SAM protein [Anaerolineales bacterium]